MSKKNKPIPIIERESRTINLALQGGGAHAAFTWGVLDRLLDESNLSFEAICATSGGAINAVLVAYGMIVGSRKEAQKMLAGFWKKISDEMSLSPLKPSFMDKFFNNKNLDFSPNLWVADSITRMLSPYQLNLFGLNPVRDILSEMINFEVIRKHSEIKLFFNATNVKTGKIKIFEEKELELEMILASACLPLFYQAVEINGEYYWDGGYSGNPALFPIFYNCASSDIVIVQVNPFNSADVPINPADIMDRVNMISFNSTLMREMRSIAFIKKLIDEKRVDQSKYKNILVHLIGAESIIAGLVAPSKMNADWGFLTYLRDVGRQSADDWLNNHYDKIGVESSIDIQKMFLD